MSCLRKFSNGRGVMIILVSTCLVMILTFFATRSSNEKLVQKMTDLAEKATKEHKKTLNFIPSPHKIKDKIDSSPALSFLKKYHDVHSKKNPKAEVGNPKDPSTIKEWWQAVAIIHWYFQSPLRYSCKNIKAVGNYFICQDKPYFVKPPCLVYSFGIDWRYSFDDAMGKLGCEVHSFDPSMGIDDHKRNENVTFHNLGLGGSNTDEFVPKQDNFVKGHKVWKTRTVKRIKEMLGHEGRVIDVFKIDIEGYEWSVIDNMLDTDMFDYIRQFDIEFHLNRGFPLEKEYVNIYNTYRKLQENGLRHYKSLRFPKGFHTDYKAYQTCEQFFVNNNF